MSAAKGIASPLCSELASNECYELPFERWLLSARRSSAVGVILHVDLAYVVLA